VTQLNSDAAQQLDTTRQNIAAGLTLVDAASHAATDEVLITDEVDLSQVTCSLSGAALTTLQPQLRDAASAGHRVTATATSSGSELTLSWRSEGGLTTSFTGEPGELASQRDADAFARAISRDDGIAALSYLNSEVLRLEIVVKAPANGAGWIRTHHILSDRLGDGRWASTLIRLTTRGGDRGAVVLVQDAGDAVLRAPGLILAGPQATVPSVVPSRDTQLTQSYRARAAFRARPDIFTPAELTCSLPPTGLFAPLGHVLDSAARASAWYWLADSVVLDPDRVMIHFDGVASIELELTPYGAGPPTAETALAEWATATGEPSRADAIQQAITFAIRSSTDLASAATPVLRTARSLYELAGRGLISEALAARRSARDSAVTAARAAATAARDVATKSVERTLALVVAAAVALFANARKFIDDGTSYAIIAALAIIGAAALAIAWLVDTRSGESVLDAFDADVELYRDTLSEDDIQATKGLAALAKAREDLKRARMTASLVYGSVILTVLLGGSIIIASRHDSTKQTPPTSPSSVSTSPAPAPSQSHR